MKNISLKVYAMQTKIHPKVHMSEATNHEQQTPEIQCPVKSKLHSSEVSVSKWEAGKVWRIPDRYVVLIALSGTE